MSCRKSEIGNPVSGDLKHSQSYENHAFPFSAMPTEINVQNVGVSHNFVLDHMIDDINVVDFFENPNDLSGSFVNTVSHGRTLIEADVISSIDGSNHEIYERLNSTNLYNFKTYCNTIIYSEIENLPSNEFSILDQTYFSQIKDILNKDYSAPENIGDNLKHDLIDLKNQYEVEGAEINDLIMGSLNVGIASAEYWENFSRLNPEDSTIISYDPLIVQADAAGYIVGWTKAWLWDQLPTGGQRINAGLGVAGATSFMWLLKKWGKF